MSLMISETAPRSTLDRTRANTYTETISYATSGCILGQVLVARSVKGVCAILLGGDRYELKADLATRFPKVSLVSSEAIIHDELAKVIRFLDKPSEGLRLPLDMRGTPLQRRVWEKLRAIPAGRTVRYTQVAHWVGPLTPARVVAGAYAANPIDWPFLVTASCAAMAILGAIAGVSSASVKWLEGKRWHERPFVQCVLGLCRLFRKGAGRLF